MIPFGAWALLRALPEARTARGVMTELDALLAKGDHYWAITGRAIGALLIGAVVCVVSVALEHVWLARAGTLLVTATIVLRMWQRDVFDKDWRRAEYLRGYLKAKAGMDPDPP